MAWFIGTRGKDSSGRHLETKPPNPIKPMWEIIKNSPYAALLVLSGILVLVGVIFYDYKYPNKEILTNMSPRGFILGVLAIGGPVLIGTLWSATDYKKLLEVEGRAIYKKTEDKRQAEIALDKALFLINGPPPPPRIVPTRPEQPQTPPKGMKPNTWNCAFDGQVVDKIGVFRSTEEFVLTVEHPTLGKLRLKGGERYDQPPDKEIRKQYPDLRVFVIEGEVFDPNKSTIGTFTLVDKSWESGYGQDLRGTLSLDGKEDNPIRLRVLFP
ncbi:MAG: hypothetical protein RJB39_211 [Candidatus Parcubacteria bacterium]|jgi:hypothetical protein